LDSGGICITLSVTTPPCDPEGYENDHTIDCAIMQVTTPSHLEMFLSQLLDLLHHLSPLLAPQLEVLNALEHCRQQVFMIKHQ